ncbi:Uncharacterised protein [Klebsiella michiganensis]|nr:Uncharacterised protein [Klebsiella michiganensis]
MAVKWPSGMVTLSDSAMVFFAVRQGQLVAAQTGDYSGHFLRDS